MRPHPESTLSPGRASSPGRDGLAPALRERAGGPAPGGRAAEVHVGLDIGGTKTLGVALDATGEVRAQVQERTVRGPQGVLATAARVVRALRQETGRALAGPVGVGIPGLVDRRRGAVKHAVNLGLGEQWLPVAELLAAQVGSPVVLDNDVNAATLGAASVLDEDDLVLISIGTGLAAGLLLDGRLRRGERGAAGEVGHLPFETAGARCGCGQRGCLETVSSGAALAADWSGPGAPAPAQRLFDEAAAGRPDAVAARQRFVRGVAEAIRVLGLSVDPRVVVLGGGVAQVGEPLRVAVAAELVAQAGDSPVLAALDLASRVRLVPAGCPVAAMGAAMLGRSAADGVPAPPGPAGTR